MPILTYLKASKVNPNVNRETPLVEDCVYIGYLQYSITLTLQMLSFLQGFWNTSCKPTTSL